MSVGENVFRAAVAPLVACFLPLLLLDHSKTTFGKLQQDNNQCGLVKLFTRWSARNFRNGSLFLLWHSENQCQVVKLNGLDDFRTSLWNGNYILVTSGFRESYLLFWWSCPTQPSLFRKFFAFDLTDDAVQIMYSKDCKAGLESNL